MSTFFPRKTVEWHLEEPPAFRKLSISLVEMALITGVVLRLLRAFAFTLGHASSLYLVLAFVIGSLFLLGMTTAHVANFTVRSWAWRAPLFALVEVAGEMLTSLALIALHREPEGSGRAEFGDWPSMALRALLQSEFTIILSAALLAGAIVFFRRTRIAANVETDPLDPSVPLVTHTSEPQP